MKLATFTHRGFTRVGVVVADRVIDLSQAAPGLPDDMVALLAQGEGAMQIARSARRSGAAIALEDVHLEAPVLMPRKFLAIGMNYPRNGEEPAYGESLKAPRGRSEQIWFNKQVTCVNGPFDPIELPRASGKVIYEVELAFVIGQRCRHVTGSDASSAIAGYLICNDVTVVDWVLRSPTATLGKSFDTHGPLGPWLVTADEVGDPQALGLRSYVNGAERQCGSTAQMHFSCPEMVEYLSSVFTLEPGDVITTGTPSRVSEYLKVDDTVRCEIDGIGHIENVVIAES